MSLFRDEEFPESAFYCSFHGLLNSLSWKMDAMNDDTASIKPIIIAGVWGACFNHLVAAFLMTRSALCSYID